VNKVHNIIAVQPTRLVPDEVGYCSKTDNQRQIQFAAACQGPGGKQEEDRRHGQKIWRAKTEANSTEYPCLARCRSISLIGWM
jgi:hypothetical protein